MTHDIPWPMTIDHQGTSHHIRDIASLSWKCGTATHLPQQTAVGCQKATKNRGVFLNIPYHSHGFRWTTLNPLRKERLKKGPEISRDIQRLCFVSWGSKFLKRWQLLALNHLWPSSLDTYSDSISYLLRIRNSNAAQICPVTRVQSLFSPHHTLDHPLSLLISLDCHGLHLPQWFVIFQIHQRDDSVLAMRTEHRLHRLHSVPCTVQLHDSSILCEQPWQQQFFIGYQGVYY